MKKIFIVIVLLLSIITMSSCDTILTQNKKTSLDLEIVYFYGFFEDFIENDYVARMLYDYNEISFNIKSPDKFLIPGDIFHLETRGNIFCEESFPGRLVLDSYSILNKQEYYYTKVVEIKEEDIIRDSNGYILDVKNFTKDEEFIILDNDLSFIELSKYNGEKLYASLKLDKNKEVIENSYACLFAFNPR